MEHPFTVVYFVADLKVRSHHNTLTGAISFAEDVISHCPGASYEIDDNVYIRERADASEYYNDLMRLIS